MDAASFTVTITPDIVRAVVVGLFAGVVAGRLIVRWAEGVVGRAVERAVNSCGDERDGY